MHKELRFLDILEPRRTETGIFRFMTRAWYPKRTQVLDKIYSPQDIKDITAASLYLETVIEAESLKNGKRKESLKKEVYKYIDEIGMDKKLHRIRWLGIFALKLAFNMNIGIFVNDQAILKVKDGMGKNPLLFLPTHRSYADFCILTYLCYHYNIDFPAVASGMDFYSMAVIGQLLRDTCAFYIRRTLVGAPVYAATLKQYVRTLVAKHCAPIEFFLEGTRSRSNKSLCPKYGMLSMALMPFFAREVPDITIVPVNISYDRLMEQTTFAYEHLGVPKPKESTKGLLKWLSTLNDNFGNMYINIGEPISVRDYVLHIPHSVESLKPIDLQEISQEQFRQVQEVAEFTVTQQQQSTVATISNLLAIVLMQSLMQQRCLSYEEVLEDVEWVEKVLRKLGATVFEENARKNVDRILSIHSKWWTLDSEKKLRIIVSDTIQVTDNLTKKMKGHLLRAETMMNSIPIVQLQMYVNPILHYIVPPALIYALVCKTPISLDTLRENFRRLRKLLRYEFFHIEKHEEDTYVRSLEFCVSSGLVSIKGGEVAVERQPRLQSLLRGAAWPALATLLHCADVALQWKHVEHKAALQLVQECAERALQHPYCLSLDAAANCLLGYVSVGALYKDKQNQNTYYNLVDNVMEEYRELVRSVLPDFKVDFSSRNPVVLDRRAKSRL